MKAIPPQEITLGQFTLVFISWGLLAVGALIWPEFTEALDPFRSASQCTANLAHLFWTFAYLMFLLHAYWAIFVIFDGVRDTFAQMGIIIAGMNFLLLGWWGLDVVLLWTVPSESNRMHRFQRATRVFTFLVFALTLIVLRGGPARVLGGVFVGVVALALAVRFWARDNYARPLVRP
jgi:hypothetical protein